VITVYPLLSSRVLFVDVNKSSGIILILYSHVMDHASDCSIVCLELAF